jgi:hypothetical protein
VATLYEKVGRRYVPVHDTAAYEGLPDGAWIVTVQGGRRTASKVLSMDGGFEAIAAIPDLTEMMVPLLREYSATRPARTLTAREKRAWKAYTDIMGEDSTLMLERESAWGIAHAVARKVAERAQEFVSSIHDNNEEDIP